MGLRKREAHLALDQLAEYRNHLDSRIDAPLISALTRLMNVFQSRLFLALLDIQEFYESTLLDPDKNSDEKTAAALDVALRWENISSPSLVASTIDLRRSNSSNELSSLDRPRSLYQLNLMGLDGSEDGKLFGHTKRLGGDNGMGFGRKPSRRRPYEIATTDQSNSTLSFPMPSYTPSNDSPCRWTTGTGLARLPDSAVFSSEPSQFPELQSTSSPSLPPVELQRPVAKPRQRRLKRTKSTTHSMLLHGSEWRQPDTLTDQRSPVFQHKDAMDSSQWGPLSHLPTTTEVVLDKTPQGFGFSIAGGRDDSIDPPNANVDILVTRINPGGAADRSGGLRVNDRILSVNGISLIGVSHEEAVRALQLAGSRLRLVVERKSPLAFSENVGTPPLAYPPMHTQNKSHTMPPVSSSFSPSSLHKLPPNGSGTSTASTGAMSMSSGGAALTNTSLASGSLFDPGSSRHTTTSTGTSEDAVARSKVNKAATEIKKKTTNHRQEEPPQPSARRQQSMELPGTSETSQKTPASRTAVSTPGYRRGRKTMASSGFPAFSWCTGLHKTTGCAGLLGSGHRSLPIGSNTHQRTPSDASGDGHSSKGRQRTASGSRPVPVPPPGPVVVEVVLSRGTKSGLGFSIAGGVGNETVDGDTGIFVTKLTPGGVAETDGRISIGDRIVQVNNTSLVEVAHEQAVNALKQAGEQVRLILVKQTIHPSRLVWTEPDTDNRSKPSLEKGKCNSMKSGPQRSASSMNNKGFLSPSDTGDESTPQRNEYSETTASPRSPSSQQIQSDEEGEKPDEGIVSPCFAPTGQELLEEQMAGLIDYTAAAVVADLVSRWPRARMVTLYRSGKPASLPHGGTQVTTPQAARRSVGGSLGLNIVGGDGSEATFVSQVQSDKPAGLSKRVFVGDRVLAVNGIDVTEHGHEQAAAALRNAPDRVDLVLVYSPEEYTEFEKYYSRQLQAVGHKLSAKALRKTSLDRGVSNRSKERHRKRSTGHHRRPSASERNSLSISQSLPTPGTNLFLRCQVDYDPATESHKSAPKKSFTLRSGDLLCVFDWTDPEWWQAQRLDPTSNEPFGPVGLVPSRARLQRRERTRTRHVNFLARAGRSAELIGMCPSLSTPIDDDEGASTPQRRDQSRGFTISATSLSSGGTRKPSHKDSFVLSYITVTPVQLSFARPVVILGHMKDRLADELLCEYPDRFGTAVPYTTRACRPNEVEGRDYHFVVSREIMVADIAAQRYLEAGEYNGNLYGTHLESVFEVAELGLNCLLDVGGPALKRLEAAGLPAIAILMLPEAFPSGADHSQSSPHLAGDSTGQGMNTSSGCVRSPEVSAFFRMQAKLARLIRHFSNYLTAIITTDDFDLAYQRIKELIFENSGPLVWLNTPQPIP
uniref:Disks large homolog 1 n=1 Tax=Cryptocotyle lingua TaxID=66766 RepID=A0A7U0TI69_9TREM|nr:disks large homolog 1 [Cryptocotyle lingua]